MSQLGQRLLAHKPAGTLALNDVTITDRAYPEAANSIGEFLRGLDQFSNHIPVPLEPIPFFTPSAGNVVSLGTIGASVNDTIAIFKPTFNLQPYVGNGVPPLWGFHFSQRFTNNASTGPYTMKLRYVYVDPITGVDFGILTDMNRDLVIEPTEGANSALEALIVNMGPGVRIQYNATTKNCDQILPQKQGFMTPIKMARFEACDPINGATVISNSWTLGQPVAGNALESATEGCVFLCVILQGMAAVSQNASITPLLATSDAAPMAAKAFQAVYSELQ